MFFGSKKMRDNNEFIYGSDNMAYPLTQPENYEYHINTIYDIFRGWMELEEHITNSRGADARLQLVTQLQTIDIKLLGFPEILGKLLLLLEDNELTVSGSRMFDAITRISMVVPVDTLEVIKGKFLYNMLYMLPDTINSVRLPTKEMWLDAIKEHPWIPLLVFIQQLLDDRQSAPAPTPVNGNVPEVPKN